MTESSLAVAHTIEINDKYTVLNPQPLLEHLKRVNRPYEHVLKCNRFVLPAGRHYGRGWLLMRYADLKELYAEQDSQSTTNPAWNIYRQFIRFKPHKTHQEAGFKIERLAVSRVFSVLGFTQDPLDSLELADHYAIVELVDARYSARMTTLYKGYNVRTFNILNSSDQAEYWDDTINGAYPWTWNEVVSDLFGKLPAGEFASTNVDLTGAVYPSHYPMDLKFAGISAWDALMEVLHNTRNTLVRNNAGKWFVKSYTVEQPSDEYDPSDLEKYLEDPTWDLPRSPVGNPTGNANINVPEKMAIYFPRMFHAFQGLADTKIVDGGDAWDGLPLYEVEKTVSASGVAGTKVGVFSSLYADYDEAGSLLNASQLSDVATEMASQFKAAKGWTDASLHNTYLYYHKIQCGSEVSAVQWSNNGLGGRTEVLLNPFHYTPGDESTELGKAHISEILAWECFAPPDVMRERMPVTRFLVAKLDAQLVVGGAATASVYYGTHTGTSAISWTDSGKNIQVHNLMPCIVAAGEYVACHWHVQTRRWIAIYAAPPKLFQGTLDGAMCPSDNAYSSDLHNVFCCETLSTTAINNIFNLSGLAGYKVAVYKDCQTGNYNILQVQHQAFQLVTNEFSHQDGCEYSPGIGRTIPTTDCKILYKHREFSVMTCRTTSTEATLFTAELVENVLVDWWVDGLEIKGTRIPIYVVCACDSFESLLHTGTDCAYGSGSGTGQ